MKRKCVLLLLILVQLVGMVSASGYRNYDTKPVYGEEYAELQANTANYIFVSKPETSRPIKCFAINSNGDIALAFDGEDAQIDVYSVKGEFLYGYRFPNRNSFFSVFFEKGWLSVYRAKSSYIASFDRSGNCIKIEKAVQTKRTLESSRKDFDRPSSGEIGELRYEAKRGFLSMGYGYFAVENSAGEKTVIYDAMGEIAVRNLLIDSGALCLAIFVAKNAKKEKTEEE